MAELPRGTVTLLFTDIEGSTRLLHALGTRYAEALADHRRIARAAFAEHDGVEVDTQGDAFFVAFPTATGALAAAVATQRGLAAHSWPDGHDLRLRMGIHTGEPTTTEEGYVGLDLHRGARIASAGHGGQVLVSETTRQLLVDQDLDGLALRDLGEHRLKDLSSGQRLYQVVGEGLLETFPPLKSLDSHPTNLPVQPTAMLGREAELDEVVALLGRWSLVTLTGPGGTGKTRLALQAAADASDLFADGVFFVDLSTVIDPDLVVAAIAQAIGVREGAGRTLTQALLDLWAGRSVLLVLDNFEQIVSAAPAVAGLLAGCPGLTLLVTSRLPLHLRGEHEWPVPPLAGREALALFVERAQAVKPSFALTPDNALMVGEICARLDGLPLAVELAAARVKVLSPSAIVERLGRRLDLLVTGSSGAPPRQQTLRATIDWSYSLLTDDQRRLFTELAVFDGWTLEAANAVAGRDVLEDLAALVDHSLVRQEETAGEPRFRMLATIREYALALLADHPSATDIRDRHATWAVELAGSARRRRVSSSRSADLMATLETEHANVVLALSWLLAQRRDQDAVQLCDGCWRGWFTYGRVGEGHALTSEVLQTCVDADPVDLAWMSTLAGEFSRFVGLLEEARRLKEAALPVLRAARPLRAAATLDDLGDIAADQGRWEDSRALHLEAEAIFAAEDEEEGITHSRAGLGRLALMQGDLEVAREHYGFVLDRGRAHADIDFTVEALTGLAHAEVRSGAPDAVGPYAAEVLAILVGQTDTGFLADLLQVMAQVEAAHGQDRVAGTLLGIVDGLMVTGGFVLYMPDTRAELADELRARLGDAAFAEVFAAGRVMTPGQATSYAMDLVR